MHHLLQPDPTHHLLLQVPTVRNVNLKYGSLAAFFAHLDADIVCMQVSSWDAPG